MAAPTQTRNANERYADSLVRQSNFSSVKYIFQGQGTPDQMQQTLAMNVQNPPQPQLQ